MIGRIGVVSHHLRSLMGVIELTVLCAFVCKVRYFNAQIRETLLYKEGVVLTCLFRKNTFNYLHGMKL